MSAGINEIPEMGALLLLVKLVSGNKEAKIEDIKNYMLTAHSMRLNESEDGIYFLAHIGLLNIYRHKYVECVDSELVTIDDRLLFQMFLDYLSRSNDELFNSVNVKLDSNGNVSMVSYRISSRYQDLIKWMLRSKIIYRHEGNSEMLLLNKRYDKVFKIFINELSQKNLSLKKYTLDSLNEKLENNAVVGSIGEKFVLEFEKKRLATHINLNNIKIISSEYVSAGYDIHSFDDVSSIFIDRLIEVKTHGAILEFYWSVNEISVAEKYADKYFIYLVDINRIDETGYEPFMIRNPFENIFNDEDWIKENTTFKVSKKNSPNTAPPSTG